MSLRVPAYAAALTLLSAALAWSGEFLVNLRKGDSRAEPDERIEYYGRAIRAWAPSDGNQLLAHCRFRRGEARYEMTQFSAAEDDLASALELDPGNAKVYLLRGRLLLRRGKHAAAARDFAEHAAMEPRSIAGPLALASALTRAGSFKAAAKAVARAHQLDPSDFRVPAAEGELRAAQRRHADALALLSRAAKLAQDRAGAEDVLAKRAECRLALGDRAGALDDLSAAVSLHDRGLAEAERAKAAPLRLLEAREGAARDYHARGVLHQTLGLLPEARADYERACGLGHQDACPKAEVLAAALRAAPKLAPARAPAPPKPPKPPKRRRLPKPESDPGERIYGG